MVNRYDEPASYGYISQYVPIPFEKLYALGKDYADQRKQAEKELENLRVTIETVIKYDEDYLKTVIPNREKTIIE